MQALAATRVAAGRLMQRLESFTGPERGGDYHAEFFLHRPDRDLDGTQWRYFFDH
ncbi:hypothetical protein GCM10028817_32830 [Spirosoma pomorum]